jgi:hypothetical protein
LGIAAMNFISLWAGLIEPPNTLPAHLHVLYNSLGDSTFSRDPEVCAERERVPIVELLEPFSLGNAFLAEATAAAESQDLRLANTVVAVYTHHAPKTKAIDGSKLRFVGTFAGAQPAHAA